MGNSIPIEKIFRGAYHYYMGAEQFTTEIFDVFIIDGGNGHQLKSETLTRLKSGDFLKISVNYQINSKYLPTEVVVEKQLGMMKVKEIFKTNFKEQKIDYTFVRGSNKEQVEIPAPGIFQIATPSAAFSLLCTKAKKPDLNIRNRYMTVKSDNTWEYSEPPTAEELYLELPSNPSTLIYIGEKELSATIFHVYASESTGQKGSEEKPVTYYLSDHIAIPYRILDSAGLKIEIKTLNNLQKNRAAI